MKTDEKQKMCSNCHGRVPIDAETCIYCAQELSEPVAEDSPAQTTLFEHQSLQDSLTSLYSPPYPGKRPTPAPSQELEAPKKRAPLFTQAPQVNMPLYQEQEEESAVHNERIEEEEEDVDKVSRGSFWSILLILFGGNIFTLGVLQFLFGDGNLLTLQWNTDHWYLYCLAALPFVFVGARLAGRLK